MTILPSIKSPKFVLVYKNTRDQRWFFVATGTDPRLPGRVLIRETTMDKEKATRFDTAPEATAILVSAVALPEWTVEAA